MALGLMERTASETLRKGTGAAVRQQLAKWRRNVLTEARYQAMDPELDRKLVSVDFQLKG